MATGASAAGQKKELNRRLYGEEALAKIKAHTQAKLENALNNPKKQAALPKLELDAETREERMKMFKAMKEHDFKLWKDVYQAKNEGRL